MLYCIRLFYYSEKTEVITILRRIFAFLSVLTLVTALSASCSDDAPLPTDVEVTVQTGTAPVLISADNTTSSTSAKKTTEKAAEETTAEIPILKPDIEKVSIDLPDLSELGIDTSTYPSEGEKYMTEFGVGCEIGYKGERPKITEIICADDDMNMLIFNEKGWLCRYDGPVISSNDAPELTKSYEEYKEMGLKYLKIIEPDFKGYDEDEFDIDSENKRCTMTMKRTYGDDMYDRLKIIYDGDGLVYQFSISRTGVRDTEAPARLRQKVVDFGTDYCEKHFHNGSAVSDIEGECFEIDGEIYGKYSFIVNSAKKGAPIYTTYEVIVRDE